MPVDDAFRLPAALPSVLSSVPHPSEQHSLTCCNNAAAATRSDTSGIALALSTVSGWANPRGRAAEGEGRGKRAHPSMPPPPPPPSPSPPLPPFPRRVLPSFPPLQSGGEFRRMMRKNIFGLTRARERIRRQRRGMWSCLSKAACCRARMAASSSLFQRKEREDKQNGEAKVLPLKFVFRDRRMPRLLPFIRGSLEGHQNI